MYSRLGAINEKGDYVHPHNANKEDKYKCLECKRRVIIKQGDMRAHHFCHQKESGCNFFDNGGESEIHKSAKFIIVSIIKQGRDIKVYSNCKRCNKKDEINLPSYTDTSILKQEYKFDESDKRADVGYKNNDKLFIFEVYYTHKTSEYSRPEPWFEVDAKNLIDYYGDNHDKIDFEINCMRSKICEECKNIKDAELESSEGDGTVYFNQRGAGCGKTFESIQLVKNNDCFKDKITYIYLTKSHSAKDVIRLEFNDQEDKKLLEELCKIVSINSSSGRQYKGKYKNIEQNKEIQLVIGTIDSFLLSVADQRHNSGYSDKFRGNVEIVRKGHLLLYKDNRVRYARDMILLDKSCIIIIDEAQDLGKEYFLAFQKILEKTHIDLFIIGDKLQSIYGEKNIMTYIDEITGVKIVKSNGVNNVMRFHNEQFKNFVNDIIPFDKFGLPEISAICKGGCKYEHEEGKPYEIFESPIIYSEDYDEYKLKIESDKIVNYIEAELEKHPYYLPNNFMIIFPILQPNKYAERLQNVLQQFWSEKFKNEEYRTNVLEADAKYKESGLNINEYWGKNYDDGFKNHVYLHKSTEYSSIDLSVSEKSTRILTIHSCKGLGCEVVFVLGMSEFHLGRNEGELKFYSMLHVALTRQKKSIYIGLEKHNDKVNEIFKKYIIMSEGEKKKINVSKYTRCAELYDFFLEKNLIFDFEESICSQRGKLKSFEDTRNKLVDYSHHIVRYSMFFTSLALKFMYKKGNNLFHIFKELSNKKIKICYDPNTYNYYLMNSKKNLRGDKSQLNEILILSFGKYDKYYEISRKLKKEIKKLQDIMKSDKNFDIIDSPLYCVIFCYILQFVNKESHYIKDFSEINIMKVYEIMTFLESEEILPLSNHYTIMRGIVSKIWKNYVEYVNEFFGCEITYNTLNSSGTDIRDFTLMNNYSFFGVSDNFVIYFIIKPQLTEALENEILVKVLLNNFLSVMSGKFSGKKKYTCVFTLYSEKPIIYEIELSSTDIVKMVGYVGDFLRDKYRKYNDNVIQFYEYCKNNRTKSMNSFEYMSKEIKKEIKLPAYIQNYIIFCKESLKELKGESKKNKAIALANSMETDLNSRLDGVINSFTNPVEEVDEEDF